MKLLRLAIWLATAFFVVMLFLPLVREMIRQLRLATEAGMFP